eukprot:MONOS_3492.1-p1 / transcript=MONOS_3492.1 / gene=MONOS_3492 / organism=Monocercomonoides_exilis_PA203 / gene_product=unspecified product / transcript_product=unspecified product / location=Mono_scaffold00082:130640-131971(-) / protein_length=278 / sequence_SO=supercontig / SO=protein_coding / is_pseudo=false
MIGDEQLTKEDFVSLKLLIHNAVNSSFIKNLSPDAHLCATTSQDITNNILQSSEILNTEKYFGVKFVKKTPSGGIKFHLLLAKRSFPDFPVSSNTLPSLQAVRLDNSSTEKLFYKSNPPQIIRLKQKIEKEILEEQKDDELSHEEKIKEAYEARNKREEERLKKKHFKEDNVGQLQKTQDKMKSEYFRLLSEERERHKDEKWHNASMFEATDEQRIKQTLITFGKAIEDSGDAAMITLSADEIKEDLVDVNFCQTGEELGAQLAQYIDEYEKLLESA